MSMTSPSNHSDTGFLFYYPIYFRFQYQSLYTTGTWQWIYAFVWLMKEHSNSKFNEFVYSTVVESSMWAYISHYFFIVLAANYIVRPMEMTFMGALATNLLFCLTCIMISDWILSKLMASKKTNDIAKKSIQIGVKIGKKLAKKTKQ